MAGIRGGGGGVRRGYGLAKEMTSGPPVSATAEKEGAAVHARERRGCMGRLGPKVEGAEADLGKEEERGPRPNLGRDLRDFART